jgi:hypothetical protein
MRTITRDLLEKLITDYDDSADVSIGGPYDTHIITPILERLDPDPLETDFPSFARQILRDEYPDLEFEEGDALNTAVAKPMQLLMRPVLDQLSVILRNGSLKNYKSMDSDEIDDLLSNMFWQRPSGGYASGPIKIYFANPITVQIGSGNVCTTKTGLRFVPTLPYSITADVMLSNKEGNLYYMTAYVTAEEPGSDYNILKESIVSISGLPSAVSIKNTRKFSGGIDTYSDDEAVDAAKLAITERTLTSNNGIITLLTSTLPGIRHAYTVGFHDDEMKRDIIKGGSAGEIVVWGRDAHIIEDGDFDDASQYVEFYATDVTDYLGPIGEVEGFVLNIGGVDYTVTEVVATNQIKVTTDIEYPPARPALVSDTDLITSSGSAIIRSATPLNFVNLFVSEGHAIEITSGADVGYYKIIEVYGSSYQYLRLASDLTATAAGIAYTIPYGYHWTLRKKTLSLSEIPYGFVDSDDEIASEVHIGGMTDIHLAGELEERTMNLLALSDQDPYYELTFGYTGIANNIMYPAAALPDGNGIEVGDMVEMLDGDGAGTYRITDIVGPNLYVTPDPNAAAGTTRCKFSRTIDIELSDPIYSKYEASDLVATIGSNVITTAAATGFTALGVIVGDYVRIPSGDDKGDWIITAISGTGGQILTVNHTFTKSYTSLAFEVLSKQDAIDLPVVDIETVELLDTNNESTGEYIPYGKPLDVRALGPFTNIGHGEATEFTGVQTGIIGTADISGGVAVNGLLFGIYVNGVDFSFNFGAGTNLPQEIVDDINAEVPDCASIHSSGAAEYLMIQSTNRLITITGGASPANALLGIAVTEHEYSDQMIKTGVDWLDVGVSLRDVVTLAGDPNSYYRVYKIDGATNNRLRAYKLFTDSRFWGANASIDAEIGERSLGLVRCYFKDPTYFTVCGPRTVADLGQLGVDDLPWEKDVTKLVANTGDYTLNYCPDTAMDDPLIPSGSTQPNNGYANGFRFESIITGGTTIDNRSARIDFPSWGVRVGDILELTVVPLIGVVDLAAAAPLALSGDTLEFTLDGYNHVVEFDGNDTTIDAVIDAINIEVGTTLAYKNVNVAAQYLVLETDLDLTLTADSGGVMGLGMPASNEHPDVGEYLITDTNVTLDVHIIDVENTNGSPVVLAATYNSHFKVKRTGLQRFDPADMIEGDDGLYYVDIEVMSEGYGDVFNVEEKQLFTISDYEAYGWYLSTENEATSYSEYEKLWIHIKPYFLPQDENYDPDSIYMMAGQNIQISYNKSYLVEEAQTYVETGGIRNLNQNVLARHLLPVFVYFSVDYAGGSETDVMEETLEELVEAIMPDTPLTVYGIVNSISSRGAEALTSPIELAAIVWEDDRSARIERSENEVNPGSRYVMYVGSIELTRT